MPKANPNKLLVEGDDEMYVIPFFMEKFLPWGKKRNTWPVEIEPCNGIESMLEDLPEAIEAELREPGRRALGIIADANKMPEIHWQRIRRRSLMSFPDLPEELPGDGLIWPNADGQKLGVWLMPDNRAHGMLETFLQVCVLEDGQPLWKFVEAQCAEAKKHGAPYKDAHLDKARIHAWLALQDPPGQSLQLAVLSNTLNPQSPHAAKFVQWFRTLFAF